MSEKRAVVLVSGGLDSATTLAIAKAEGFRCCAMTCLYGQRHAFEVEAARRVGEALGVEDHKTVTLDLRVFGGSALTDEDLKVPKGRNERDMAGSIPATYVPARNTIFLSLALAWAETLNCFDIFLGVNAVDYSGYPDCRPVFIEAYEQMANLATAAGVSGEARYAIHTPIIELTKGEIIRRGLALGVDYALTHSCYDPNEAGASCGRCDACLLRLKGFEEVGVKDPVDYYGDPSGSV